MEEPFIGEIRQVSFTYAPRGWAMCNGQVLPISQYQTLFSLISNNYGGDGVTSFALPDLRGRVSIHAGSGPGRVSHLLGSRGGTETVTLTNREMPNHTHSAVFTGTNSSPANLKVYNNVGNQDNVIEDSTKSLAITGNPASGPGFAEMDKLNFSTNQADSTIRNAITGIHSEGTVAINSTGGGLEHNNMQPYITVNYIIALMGIYPPRT